MTTVPRIIEPNLIASTAYSLRQSELHLTCLTTEVRPNNAGPYYYLVTQQAMAHTAFRTRHGLQRWMNERGLTLNGMNVEDIPMQRDDVLAVEIVGTYRNVSHQTSIDEFAKLRGHETWKLDNAEWSRGVIIINDRDEHEMHYLNVNYRERFDYGSDERIAEYRRITALMDGDDTIVPSIESIYRDAMSAHMPDIDAWHMVVDMRAGGWCWEHADAQRVLWATPWYEGSVGVPLQCEINNEHEILDAIAELPDVTGCMLAFARTGRLREDAQRYVDKITPVLRFIEQLIPDRPRRELYDADSIANGMAKLVAEIDDFEFPAVHRVESFEIAGLSSLSGNAGFVMTMQDGSSFIVTVTQR